MPRIDKNAGYTLMEMLVASASAGVVLVGLTSAMYVASQTLDIEEGSGIARARQSRALSQLLDDVSEALSFSERTSTAITFTVPDRTGDGLPDEIRYAWSGGANTSLDYSMNGVSSTLIEDVQSLQFDFVLRTIEAPVIPDVTAPRVVVFEEFADAQLGSSEESISIATPAGVAENDLLIAAVAIDSVTLDFVAPAGWNLLDHDYDPQLSVSFAVLWKIAGASEPANHSFSWTIPSKAYGWIMRFSGHDTSSPIHAFAIEEGRSSNPTAPAVTTTVDNCMILRLGGFDDDDVTNGDAGVIDHTTICAGESNNGSGSASGAAAYAMLESAGSSGTARFDLNGNEQYRTVTIAIPPE